MLVFLTSLSSIAPSLPSTSSFRAISISISGASMLGFIADLAPLLAFILFSLRLLLAMCLRAAFLTVRSIIDINGLVHLWDHR